MKRVKLHIDRRQALKHETYEKVQMTNQHRVARYYKHPYVNLATIWLAVAITDIQPKIAWHNSEWNFYGAAFFELNVLSRLQPAQLLNHPSPLCLSTFVCNLPSLCLLSYVFLLSST